MATPLHQCFNTWPTTHWRGSTVKPASCIHSLCPFTSPASLVIAPAHSFSTGAIWMLSLLAWHYLCSQFHVSRPSYPKDFCRMTVLRSPYSHLQQEVPGCISRLREWYFPSLSSHSTVNSRRAICLVLLDQSTMLSQRPMSVISSGN